MTKEVILLIKKYLNTYGRIYDFASKSTAYYLQGNKQVELTHKTLGKILAKLVMQIGWIGM